MYLSALAAICAAVGCGDDSAASGPGLFDPGELPEVVAPDTSNDDDTDGDPSDAAVDDEPPPAMTDAGVDAATGDGADASTMADASSGGVQDSADDETVADLYFVGEVRTNVPHVAYVNRGNQDLHVISLFVRQISTPSFESILLHGEYENRGGDYQCIPIFDSVSLGGWDILTIAEAPEHADDSNNTIACLPPGGRSVFRGIENEVPAALVEDALEFSYDLSALVRDYRLHPATPTIVTAARYEHEGGWGFTGRILSSPMPIYNMAIDFYAKDARGLIVDDTSAYPLDLDTIPSDSVVDYTSFLFSYLDGPPDGYVVVTSFIEGTRPSSSASVDPAGEPLSPEAERKREAQARRARLRELEEQLP